jgi:hypothetical protein
VKRLPNENFEVGIRAVFKPSKISAYLSLAIATLVCLKELFGVIEAALKFLK